jgi:LL-diaminopimelate aminotransferase
MATANPHFSHLKKTYIFSLIEEKIDTLKADLPHREILNFGIGDVALPLAPSIAQAIAGAAYEMTRPESIRGYGPSSGYSFLKQAIWKHDLHSLGIEMDAIFISEGINRDIVDILDLFDLKTVIGITSPTYPAYLDAALLRGHKIVELPCCEENQFAPRPPSDPCHLIYLCSPNNPTGIAMTRSQLTAWVDYAREHRALLLFDAAYEAFVSSPDVPRSIFEIEGATECAIEFRSFSKSAGFTGLRCGYTLIPHTVQVQLGDTAVPLHSLWNRRQATKSNGVSYPIQRGAEAVYSSEGHQETRAQVMLYLAQAAELKRGIESLGLICYGGIDSPYLWIKTPEGKTSWGFFEDLLKSHQILTIPGAGFGSHGEGFVRLSAFTTPEKAALALKRFEVLADNLIN